MYFNLKTFIYKRYRQKMFATLTKMHIKYTLNRQLNVNLYKNRHEHMLLFLLISIIHLILYKCRYIYIICNSR